MRNFKFMMMTGAVLAALMFVSNSPALAVSSTKGGSCVETTEECTKETSNPLLVCWKCKAKDTSKNKFYEGTACRKKTQTTPTDQELKDRALKNALKSCENSSRTIDNSEVGPVGERPVSGARGATR